MSEYGGSDVDSVCRIAEIAVLLASGKVRFITGSNIVVDGDMSL
jgi:hypothetical protein